MRKLHYTIWVILISAIATSQDIKTVMPTILGPSPTVASLMKFEETPINNYTGMPDISIPLYSSATHSKDIKLDISLKYHPENALEEKHVGDVGSGWTLMAGGTISRSVRGFPDEYYKMTKRGIYNDTPWAGITNNFYEIFTFLNDTTGTVTEPDLNKFLWYAQVEGALDTEHDLWQFNFMGQTGRFYIEKDSLGALAVKPLDDYRLKIVNHYNTSTFAPESFDIYDDKGYMYVFDVVEHSSSSSSTVYSSILPMGDSGVYPSSAPIAYDSAFHLSKIYGNNDHVNPIVEFQYTSQTITEGVSDSYHTTTTEQAPQLQNYIETGCDKTNINPPQGHTTTSSGCSTHVKKLTDIIVEGFAKIHFKFSKGRNDLDFIDADSAYVFKGFTVSNWYGDSIKKVSLSQYYGAKLRLDSISFGNFENTKTETYALSYGYPFLNKILLPTGGCTLYEYEPGTYSFIGSTVLDDFPEETELIEESYGISHFTDTASFTLSGTRTVSINALLNTFGNPISEWLVEIKDSSGNIVGSFGYSYSHDIYPIGTNPCENGNCGQTYTLAAGTYTIFFSSTKHSDFPTTWGVEYNISYTQGTGIIKKYHYDEKSYRIKTVAYLTDGSVTADYYFSHPGEIIPAKEKHYDYSLFADTSKSSGSLMAKRIYSYSRSKRECSWCSSNEGITIGRDEQTFYYNVMTDFPNLESLKTHGMYIGYQNVRVYETGNGWTEYTYSSPYDVPPGLLPEDLGPPFAPVQDTDYERGLLHNEKIFDQSGNLLKETTMDYGFERFKVISGYKVFFANELVRTDINSSANYSVYMDIVQECAEAEDPETSNYCFCNFGQPVEFVGTKPVYESYGWAKLTSKITKDYFYSPNLTVQTDETFDYNPDNKEISLHTTTDSTGNTLETDYTYDTGNNAPGSYNRISEIKSIETKKGSATLSKTEMEYDDDWEVSSTTVNESFLPKTVKTAKGANSEEPRLHFNKYDTYGNLLEVQQEGGVPTVYIWGYNETLPVAKIELMAYDSMMATSGLATIVAAIKTHSDANNESALFTDLANLRNNSALAGAMVTTYTYKPLVGVSSITDPKGETVYYEYDEFGRLKYALDKDQKVLSKNDYHYTTQD